MERKRNPVKEIVQLHGDIRRLGDDPTPERNWINIMRLDELRNRLAALFRRGGTTRLALSTQVCRR